MKIVITIDVDPEATEVIKSNTVEDIKNTLKNVLPGLVSSPTKPVEVVPSPVEEVKEVTWINQVEKPTVSLPSGYHWELLKNSIAPHRWEKTADVN